ncbi:16225_t:CDS:2 [Rhizophagus irregularis]|nr:16225_t:CDS:2 [Rhizophagus irregularis]
MCFPYTLVERSGHTANVSKPFNLDSTLPISDLSNDSRYVNAYGNGVSTICDPNKDTIFLICGVSENNFIIDLSITKSGI